MSTLLKNIQSKIYDDNTDKKINSIKFTFFEPIPNNNDSFDFYDFCSQKRHQDFYRHYRLNNSNNVINTFLNQGKTVLELLNDYKMNNSFTTSSDKLLAYISLLYHSRNIFANNGQCFEYINGEDVIKSTSIDFELCMGLYLYAYKQQQSVDDDSKNKEDIRNNIAKLINAEKCFDEAYNIARHCKEKIMLMPSKDNTHHLVLKDNKRFISNNIKITGFGSKDTQDVMLQHNTESLNSWIEDIGGLDLMTLYYVVTLHLVR